MFTFYLNAIDGCRSYGTLMEIVNCARKAKAISQDDYIIILSFAKMKVSNVA